MKKDFLIEQAKIAAQGEPISRYSDLEWSATSSFLHKFACLIANPSIAEEREKCAKMLEVSTSELLLMAGEMSAQEKRTVKAVLKALAAKIRTGDTYFFNLK